MNPEKWELFRCIYDGMGQFAIEGECSGVDDNRFEKCVEEGYGEIGWLIGVPIVLSKTSAFIHVYVRVVLEGNKETLEYILELIQENNNES